MGMEQLNGKRFCGKSIHEYEGFDSALHSIQMSNTHMNQPHTVALHTDVNMFVH